MIYKGISRLLLLILLGAIPQLVSGQGQLEFIKNLKSAYPKKEWEAWQSRTAEQAPDFNRLVKAKDKTSLLAQYKYWVIGHEPAGFAPRLRYAKVLSRTTDHAITITEWGLTFSDSLAFTVLTFSPDVKSQTQVLKRVGVYMTQGNHDGCAMIAAQKGLLGVTYPGNDDNDYGLVLQKRYPNADWSLLHARAWVARLTLQWIKSRPDVDTNTITIAGHSRNGKQSLIAAALDPGFKAVISSSAGTGGDTDWNLTGPEYNSETIEKITGVFPNWFHPRVRWFTGQEQYFPVEQSAVMGQLILPRRILILASYAETQINPYGLLKTAERAAAYQPKGKQTLSVVLRNGRHAIQERDINLMVEWAKGVIPQEAISRFVLPKQSPQAHPMVGKCAGMERKSALQEPDYQQLVMGFPNVKQADRLDFGSYHAPGVYLNVSVYGPKEFWKQGGAHPCLVWRHEQTHQSGWQRLDAAFIDSLAVNGVCLVVYERPCMGSRFPQWLRQYKSGIELLPDTVEEKLNLEAVVKSALHTSYLDSNQVHVVTYGRTFCKAMHVSPTNLEVSLSKLNLGKPVPLQNRQEGEGPQYIYPEGGYGRLEDFYQGILRYLKTQ